MRILVLGASGMLGSTAYRVLGKDPRFEAFGTIRSERARQFFPNALAANLRSGVDVENLDGLVSVLEQIRPEVVINCVGVVKQLGSAKDPLVAIPLNALLPHRLARLCGLLGARLIHISTDCVFTGAKGNYSEDDSPDAEDLYGRSKLLGEVDYPNAVTLRTSIIGHELESRTGLVEWFLGETGEVRGFTKAIFSGVTTDELTRIIADRVIPRADLRGVYHVSTAPIAKYDLLRLLNSVYGRETRITADTTVAIDRSLDSSRFGAKTGYEPPSWPEMIRTMHETQTLRAGT